MCDYSTGSLGVGPRPLFCPWPRSLGAPSWRGLRFAPLYVAQERLWCDHECPRWGGHTSESIATSSALQLPPCSAHWLLSYGRSFQSTWLRPFAKPRPDALTPLSHARYSVPKVSFPVATMQRLFVAAYTDGRGCVAGASPRQRAWPTGAGLWASFDAYSAVCRRYV